MQSSRSPKDTSVKLFTSEMVGAPSLTQAAGTLIGVLSACLVNGFGMQQVSSFVVTQGLGQITVPVATGWERMCVIDVAGCTDASYNGEYKLTQVSADGLRVSFPIDAPDGTVQGAAITVKLAPAGWLISFADAVANKAVFMPGTPQWRGHKLLVDDVAGANANVRAYESMTSISSGLGEFPTSAQVPTACWSKAFATTRPARWRIFADQALLYWAPSPAYSIDVARIGTAARWFGLAEPLLDADAHSVCISVVVGALTGSAALLNGAASGASTAPSSAITTARSKDGATASIASFISTLGAVDSVSGADAACGDAAGLDVGNLILSQKFLRHTANSYPRARMPGILHLRHTNVVAATNLIDVDGRVHRLFEGSNNFNTMPAGIYSAIDVEGPWR